MTKAKTKFRKETLLMILFSLSLFIPFNNLQAEGSVDLINNPGSRLFYHAGYDQQLKVAVNAGEFINVGASHVGITEGFISVYRPDGTLHTVFDDTGSTAGLAIINNRTEEVGGPTGGGTSSGSGYEPGVIFVDPGTEGVWTITLEFPTNSFSGFTNIPNGAFWDRVVDQPTNQRAILAWDITVSQNNPGNENGALLTGRVFTNEYVSIVDQNENSTTVSMFLLTKDGFMYEMKYEDIDPWIFYISANSFGIVDANQQPTYKSILQADYIRSSNVDLWAGAGYFLYDTQEEDNGGMINHKIFFNMPATDLPASGMVTNVFSENTYETWLLNEVPTSNEVLFSNVAFVNSGPADGSTSCITEDYFINGGSSKIIFDVNTPCSMKLSMDLNEDGDYDDPEDIIKYKFVDAGTNFFLWNGLDGLGNSVEVGDEISLNFKLEARGGEVHMMAVDIENINGGISFNRLNGPNAPSDVIFYDNTGVDGTYSGGGTTYALPDVVSISYGSNWGNNTLLDFWSLLKYNGQYEGETLLEVVGECATDTDMDGISDDIDIDDDNDGITDKLEYAQSSDDFIDMQGGIDPSGDDDGDSIPNYIDVDFVGINCPDVDGDGKCDALDISFDTDQDNVPNHLDLDTDNDGITDLIESGHTASDANKDGIIDGPPTAFGLNGLFNSIATDADDLDATIHYAIFDTDSDYKKDFKDLDSDNDNVLDIQETYYAILDQDGDGRIDTGGNTPFANPNGLSIFIDPVNTFVPISDPLDTDLDLIGNWRDLDSDNDGINDVGESGFMDEDNDGFVGTGIPNTDADGIVLMDASGTSITQQMPADTDGDLVPNLIDVDSDNDGIHDVVEALFVDQDNDGRIGSGVPSINTMGQPTSDNLGAVISTVSFPADFDSDSYPNYIDHDSDNDGIMDVTEAEFSDIDQNGFLGGGLLTVDLNGAVTIDIFMLEVTPNSYPPDHDADTHFSFLDLDSDNDGIDDAFENRFSDDNLDGFVGSDLNIAVTTLGVPMTDVDGQVFTSLLDALDTDDDDIFDFIDLDSDGDLIFDVYEAQYQDEDYDGIVGVGIPFVNNYGQPYKDSNGNNIDTSETPPDTDGDDNPDFQDIDADGDGVPDEWECSGGAPCLDTDGDGDENFLDLDSDGDLIPDEEECPPGADCPDNDENLVPEILEYNCSDLTSPVIAAASEGGTFCSGAQFVLEALNANPLIPMVTEISYTWTGPNGWTYTGVNDPSGPFKAVVPLEDASYTGTYTLEIETNMGCISDPISLFVQVNPSPETPYLSATADELCEGDMIELNCDLLIGNEASFEWYFDNGEEMVPVAVTEIPTLFMEEANSSYTGFYSVVSTLGDCASLMSNAVDISVSDLFEVAAEDDYYTISFNQTSIDMDILSNDAPFELTSDDITILEEPQHGSLEMKSNGLFDYTPDHHYIGSDQFAYEICVDHCGEDCQRAIVYLDINSGEDCFVPNVVTANGDNSNDELFIPCSVDYDNNELLIFNRWGDKVYNKQGYKNEWTGDYNGNPLPAGTYFYIFKLDKDKEEAKQGYFTLVR